jgi:hypothetical protein
VIKICRQLTGVEALYASDLSLTDAGLVFTVRPRWRKQARGEGRLLPDDSPDPEGWSAHDKFNAVLEAAALSEAELAEYCRSRGLYPEQIQRWRASCEQANDASDARSRRDSETVKAERKRNRQLEGELKRKDAALAETAALLTLRKKANAIWGDADE